MHSAMIEQAVQHYFLQTILLFVLSLCVFHDEQTVQHYFGVPVTALHLFLVVEVLVEVLLVTLVLVILHLSGLLLAVEALVVVPFASLA